MVRASAPHLFQSPGRYPIGPNYCKPFHNPDYGTIVILSAAQSLCFPNTQIHRRVQGDSKNGF